MWRNILGFVLLCVVFAGICEPQKSVETRPAVTVCDIASSPEKYDGKVVRVSALLASGFEFTVLRDPERRCNDIWVASLETSTPGLQQVAKYLNARLRNKMHPSDYSPPRFAITATFTGKIQYTHESGFMVDSKQQIIGIKGRFGHLGQYDTQVFLKSASDLQAKDLFGSVYTRSEYELVE
ncbi:MAG TPA: hypothetical protein VNO32_33380 [Candidatus Acidoferrum sp.]|nr:hypothetical protein [Candidatus Acidoferrum sp.]